MTDKRRRFLFVMQYPGYLRYFDSTVRGLAARGHDVGNVGVGVGGSPRRRRMERHGAARVRGVPGHGVVMYRVSS